MLTETDFHKFERAGWQRAASSYHQGYARLTIQAGSAMLRAVAAGPGKRVLDIGCGPGHLAALASSLGARPVGLDFSSEMIMFAHQLNPQLDFVLGDALYLPFADASFDAVVMNFSIHHVEYHERAIGEAYNVLKPGGRFAFTHWAKADRAVMFGFFNEAIREFGDVDAQLPPSTPFDRFNDPVECRRILLSCDFIEPTVELVPQIWRFASFDELFDAFYNGTVRMGGTLRAQSPRTLELIREQVRQKVKAFSRDGLIELPMDAIMACGVKG